MSNGTSRCARVPRAARRVLASKSAAFEAYCDAALPPARRALPRWCPLRRVRRGGSVARCSSSSSRAEAPAGCAAFGSEQCNTDRHQRRVRQRYLHQGIAFLGQRGHGNRPASTAPAIDQASPQQWRFVRAACCAANRATYRADSKCELAAQRTRHPDRHPRRGNVPARRGPAWDKFYRGRQHCSRWIGAASPPAAATHRIRRRPVRQ